MSLYLHGLGHFHPKNEISRVATEEGCGWHARQDDAPGLANRLREILNRI